MNYQYQSVTRQHDNDDESTTIVVSEITTTDPNYELEERTHYEISDEDKLTEHDFLYLMDSDEEESDSDIDDWFPSLLKSSAIELLEHDDSDALQDTIDSKAIIDEQDTDEDIVDDFVDDFVQVSKSTKRPSPSYKYKQRKRVKQSDQVPVEIDYIIIAD